MPLMQTTLHFNRPPPTLDSIPNDSVTRQEPASRPSTASSEVQQSEMDTIVVDKLAANGQLPTPDDSATDASSQSSQTPEAVEKASANVKRVVARVHNEEEDEVRLIEAARKLEGSRNVSGQTLVSRGSDRSLLRNSINALNMDWALSRADLSLEESASKSVDSLDTINVAVDAVRAEPKKKLVAKELKEKAERERQARYKAAEEKATRRSSRVTLLVDRAGSVVADLAASAGTLGKRSHNAMERSKEKLGSLKRTDSALSTSEESTNKKRKVDEPTPEKPADPQVTVTKGYRAKKYLASGLYAGQPRSFSANLNGKSNKRKSTAASTDIEASPKENSVLPLPMFACERLWKMGAEFKLPFDVFSPLPSGQPKPDEWRKMNKNTFVGDAAAYWRGNDPLLKQFRSLCGCTEAAGCDDDCQNRIMFYECNESNCSLGKQNCGNRNFADLKERSKKGGKYQIGVEVIKTPDRGYGVRSNRTFRPNQIIVEYTGEIITQEECEHRMRTTYKNNPHYYLMLFDSALVIDATARGSISRFVNHACEPNCRMEKWTVNGQPRMALFANGDRGIMTGEELTYDYNFDPFCARNVQECRCGSVGCRGFLGKRAPGEKKNSADKKDDGKEVKGGKEKKGGVLAGAKRKLQAVLDESTSALNLTKSKKQKTASTSPPSAKGAKAQKSVNSKRVASTPAKRSVSFASTTTKTKTASTGRVVKPRNSSGPNNTPVASRSVSFASSTTTKSASKSTPKASTTGKKIKARVQTPAVKAKGVKKSGGSVSSLKGLLGRSNSKSSAAAAAAA